MKELIEDLLRIGRSKKRRLDWLRKLSAYWKKVRLNTSLPADIVAVDTRENTVELSPEMFKLMIEYSEKQHHNGQPVGEEAETN